MCSRAEIGAPRGSDRYTRRMSFGPFVDAHIHADTLRDADLETLARFGVEQAIVCAHDDGVANDDRESARPWLAHWERLLTVEGPRLRRHGIRPLFAFGVHPAHAPWSGLEELLHELPRFLSDPASVAIGGLGLRDGSMREQQVLVRQLEIAATFRRPVFVSVPPLDGDRGGRLLARLLHRTAVSPDRVLVEGASPATVPVLLECGFAVALEPSFVRLEPQQIVRLVRKYGAGRFVATSHAGDGAADLLAVPGIAAHLTDAGLGGDIVARVTRNNALRLVGRPDARTKARTG